MTHNYKRLVVPIEDVFHLIYNKDAELVKVNKIKLPDNVKIIDVHYDPAYRAFLFTLESDAFESIECGNEIPTIDFDTDIWEIVGVVTNDIPRLNELTFDDVYSIENLVKSVTSRKIDNGKITLKHGLWDDVIIDVDVYRRET